jgi:alginate O-acetyltransferase complex protein AlgI
VLFSSTVFLFLFLPGVLALYFVVRPELRNAVLLGASILFYAWGEAPWLILTSVAINYAMGLWVERVRERRAAKAVLAACVVINLALIGTFKYGNFLASNLNSALAPLRLPPLTVGHIALPLGISFFTFHAMSYVVDIYRGQARAMRNPLDMALYIALFPQLVAGPIIRYHEIWEQFRSRRVTADGFAYGVRRFVTGLGKKMLIANTVATAADGVFSMPAAQLGTAAAWLGAGCYTLQIYYDFSGYSDMAIGLGRMFGFRFPENFDYPYASASVTAFWRRWHMTLSNWFRDYLYVPLGGNRRGPARTYANLLIVFALCGLWHGASWTFIAWGLYHGTFLVAERLWSRRSARGGAAAATVPASDGPLAAPLPPPPAARLGFGALGHLYTLLVVIVGWVLFRADSFGQAVAMLSAMAGFPGRAAAQVDPRTFLTNEMLIVIAVGIVGSLPWLRTLRHAADAADARATRLAAGLLNFGGVVAVLVIFVASAAKLAAGTHNPFIYFRF